MEPNFPNKLNKIEVSQAIKTSRNSILAIVFLLIVGFLFYWFLLSPKIEEVKTQQASLDQVQTQEKSVEGDVKSLQALSLQLAQHQSDINHLDQALPLNELQLRTQLVIQQLVNSSGVVVGAITVDNPSDQVVAGNLALLKDPFGVQRSLGIVGVNISVSGTMSQLLSLLTKLENYARLMDISSINLSSGSGTVAAGSLSPDTGLLAAPSNQLNMTLVLNTYYFGPQ